MDVSGHINTRCHFTNVKIEVGCIQNLVRTLWGRENSLAAGEDRNPIP
jgi:hypothetical protein